MVPSFQKRPRLYCAKPSKSTLDGLVRFWPNACGLEAGQCARIIGPGSGRVLPALYPFPTFRLGCVLPQTVRIITCKTSLDLIWSWLTMPSFGQMDPAWKSATVQSSLGSLLANASEPNRMWHVYRERHHTSPSGQQRVKCGHRQHCQLMTNSPGSSGQ